MSEREIIRVRDVMKSSFDRVDGMDTVAAALDKMVHVEAKTLVVNKRNENDEYGLVMLSDIARKVLAKDREPKRINIYEIMSKPVITVDPEMDIRYCARLFARYDLSRAPVIQGGEILGIVSYTDMVVKGLRDR
ncbi:MAG: CBS domain-containing protein [Candidatus Sedimenticola sp. (ex Thyasira tokunagai)]